jgi:transposase-like protein
VSRAEVIEAARWAMETGSLQREAAARAGVSVTAICRAMQDLGAPRRTAGRRPGAESSVPTCTACGERGHLARGERCSPVAQALRLITAGATPKSAADRVGINVESVYVALRRLRRQTPRACSACGSRDHIAACGKCSPSAQALRALAEGRSPREAADLVGITRQAVYRARARQQRRVREQTLAAQEQTP